MCILIVDDEPMIAELWSESLQDLGHVVMTSPSGQDARQLIDEKPDHFTCLVTDYHMPGQVNGGKLIEHMRLAYPAIPILLATADGSVVTRAWLKNHNVTLLIKPFGGRTLNASVQGLMLK